MPECPEMPYMRMDESLLDYAMRFNEFVEGWNRAQTEDTEGGGDAWPLCKNAGLWNAAPDCDGQTKSGPGGGIVCPKCGAWFCY